MKKQRLVVVALLVTLLVALFSGCAVKMPVPEVEEGRFNFSVVYEVNGEEKNYSGVYVCKYSGIQVALDGKARMWDSYIENANGAKTLDVLTNDEGVICIDFNFNPQYFMADPNSILFETPAPSLRMAYHSDDPDFVSFTDEIDFYKDYGVKIISYDYAEPIVNNYEEKWSLATW